MVFATRTLGITLSTEMGAVDFGPVEEAAAAWKRDSTHGGKYTDVFIAVRNLLTAAGDGADSSAVAATAIANFIRDEARKPASANGRIGFPGLRLANSQRHRHPLYRRAGPSSLLKNRRTPARPRWSASFGRLANGLFTRLAPCLMS